jgi:glutamate-1-semialdehyde 2,1-aminomutase
VADVNCSRLQVVLQKETAKFQRGHPKSLELTVCACQSMQGDFPKLWMIRWPGSFPIFVKSTRGAHDKDVDGNLYIDFCLGDTGAMTGHSPEDSDNAICKQAGKGLPLMLPTVGAIWPGEELQRRFGLK